jgi:hypothetical protein
MKSNERSEGIFQQQSSLWEEVRDFRMRLQQRLEGQTLELTPQETALLTKILPSEDLIKLSERGRMLGVSDQGLEALPKSPGVRHLDAGVFETIEKDYESLEYLEACAFARDLIKGVSEGGKTADDIRADEVEPPAKLLEDPRFEQWWEEVMQGGPILDLEVVARSANRIYGHLPRGFKGLFDDELFSRRQGGYRS